MFVRDEGLLGDTPFLAVDMDILERNIKRMAQLAAEAGVKLRPHTKTHKSPRIAQMQLDAGATGITCAKLGEAEVMADHGIEDILIAFPLIGRTKLERFHALLNRCKLTVALDDIEVAKGINQVGEHRKCKIPVYVDIDTGLQRMGRSPLDSVSHIERIAALPFLDIKGVMSHTGQAYAKDSDEDVKAIAIQDAEMMNETKQALEKKGIYIEEISIGATATARFIKEIPFATEMRPGMYAFNDRYVMGVGGATEEECAVRVMATVVAHPTRERIIIDAGSKTLSQDGYKQGGYGQICGHPEASIRSLSEEHGTVYVDGASELRIGDVVEIIPNHICPPINLADQMYAFRDGLYVETIPILGRGKNR
ncbi:alanine racemase [Cohnella abietis]|uniref:Alanine racemase n=1 Tax=Cohnella abietis TaxID=2507935 RepID=A0A3T1DEK1_9BACL|nr:alanine racemase [Cohnella abietis]BBI36523.1 alanine racemase [Cohnella abietis]